MANRLSSESVEAVTSGNPSALVSSVSVEAITNGPAAQALVSSLSVEVLVSPPFVLVPFKASTTVLYTPQLPIPLGFISSVTSVHAPALGYSFETPFISSVTVVFDPALAHLVNVPFIASTTALYAITVGQTLDVPFIASATVAYAPTLTHVTTDVDVPFIASATRVFGVFSLFTDLTGIGPGNGGEIFQLRLAPNGTTETATLAADLTADGSLLELTSDTGLPTSTPFVATIDDEVVYLTRITAGAYRIRGRGLSNSVAATHAAGATLTWDDSYNMAIAAGENIDATFTADIASSGSYTYPGWLVCFDSTQAYLAGDRYPMHVTSVLGVFDAGAGATGSNRCDAAQPNAIAVPAGVSDDCPAALSNPSRIQTDIAAGDVALIRYTNPEASPLDLGPRSAALQSWFGLKRVDDSGTDVTFTDPTGHVVDTIPASGDFTGSVDGEWSDPLGPGIAPDTGEPTVHDVPYTSVTLPGADRYFTDGTHGTEKGWPICCLAVRQGNRRVPFWRSWDWHDYSYVYCGFGLDDTYAQTVVNINILNGFIPLPGPDDIDGPDAVWDDGSYHFATAWYVAIFAGPYVVIGPIIGGTPPPPPPPGHEPPAPIIVFPPVGPPVITPPPPEPIGGSGGGIPPTSASKQLFQAAHV